MIPVKCRRYGSFSYNVVCHSKGGLWFRAGWQKMASEPATSMLSICSVITLSTPHCGSVLADYVNAMYQESLFQKAVAATGFLPTAGDVPPHYKDLRAMLWRTNPADIYLNTYYWNEAYFDLGANDVNTFNLGNGPFVREYANFDGSKPEFYGLTADADNDDSGYIESGPSKSEEWHPLWISFWTVWLWGTSFETFFNEIYDALDDVATFRYSTTALPGKITFSGILPAIETGGNDLFVTVASGSGDPPMLPAPCENLTDVITHVPMEPPSGWWNGSNPKATTHGTICSQQAGEYVSDNCLLPLR